MKGALLHLCIVPERDTNVSRCLKFNPVWRSSPGWLHAHTDPPDFLQPATEMTTFLESLEARKKASQNGRLKDTVTRNDGWLGRKPAHEVTGQNFKTLNVFNIWQNNYAYNASKNSFKASGINAVEPKASCMSGEIQTSLLSTLLPESAL